MPCRKMIALTCLMNIAAAVVPGDRCYGQPQIERQEKQPGPTKKAGDEPRLQFSFREQKWIDVLDWFAKQADLSLVVNELPPGNFTYSDTKSYTPREALDLLNGVLSTRSFTLIRRDRMLICANLAQGIPEGLVPRIELDELDQFGQFELVEVMFPLGRRPAEVVANEIKPLLGAYGNATTLPQTRQMLVTTTAGKMRVVSATLSSIPEPAAPQPVAKPASQPPSLEVYPAKNIDAKAAVEMIQALLSGVKLTVDGRTGQINAYATPDQHAVIQKLLAQMSTATAAELRPRLEVYDISHEAPTTLLQQLRSIVPDATLSLDSDLHRLVAFATADQHEQLSQTIQKLAAGAPDQADQTPVVYWLRNAQPSAVAPMLQSMYPRAKVTVDTQGSRMVVLANAEQQASIRRFVDQIETRNIHQIRVKGYPLERMSAEQARGVVSSLVPNAQINIDNEAGQLLIVATDAEHEQIAKLLEQLAAAATPVVQQSLRLFEVTASVRDQFSRIYRQLDPELADIKVLDSGQPRQLLVLAAADKLQRVAKVLDQLKSQFPEPERQLRYYEVDGRLRERFTSLRSQLAPDLTEVQMIADDSGGRMGIVATEAQHRQVEWLLGQLKQEPPQSDRSLRVFAVSPTQRSRFVAVKPSLDKLSSVRVLEESRPHELVVWGSDEQLRQIEALLPTLQAADTAMQLVTYPITQGDPASVQNVLKELYPDTKIVVDAESRRVMAWTTPDQHQVLEQAIRQLDAPPAAGKNRMAYYRLDDINSADVQELFAKLLPRMSIVNDRSTNSLIAWGSDQDHAVLARTVDEFRKQASDTAHSVVSYSCGSRDADRIRRLLDDLAPQARIVADRDNRSVIVWGTADEHQVIEQTLREMNRADDSTGASLHVYTVSRMAASDVVPLVQEIAPLARVRASEDGRQLLVAAIPKDHERIQSTIQQLEGADSAARQTKVYRLRNADVDAASDALRALIPAAVIADDEEVGVLLVTAGAEDQTRVAEVVAQLDEAGGAELQTRAFKVEKGDARAVRNAIQALVPRATLAADSSSRSLLVTASAEDMLRIEAVLKQLDESATAGQTTQVYRPQYGDVAAIQTALQALLPDAVFANDPNGRTLIATARPEQHERINAAVQQMDRRRDDQPVLQAYAVTQADVQSVYESLRTMYNGNQDVAITVDQTNRNLLVKAPPDEQRTVAQIVSQMENGAAAGESRRLILYPATTNEPDKLLASLQTLFKNQRPAVELSLNAETRQLVALATPAQHAILAEAVRQMHPEPTVVEVFPLQTADPFSIQTAIERLYADEPSKPLASGDLETQQLFVRGTRRQLEDVRNLLINMGELPAMESSSRRGVRIIPFRGDVNDALRQIQNVWPQLRKNELSIMRPAFNEPTIDPALPRVETSEPGSTTNQKGHDTDPAPNNDPKNNDSAKDKARFDTLPTAIQAEDKPNENRSAEKPTRPNEPPAPVVIVPGDGSVTILSDDEAALNQAENLLRTLSRQGRADAGAGDFAVYTLRNAGARSVARLLTDLFEQMPITSRSMMGRVSMAADERLNAVVVHGRPADRAVIAELLRVLDTSNVADSMANARPRIVPVQYMEADDVLGILRGVYETQLRSEGSRPEIEIPRGVSSEIAILLEQLNAASAGPLLTMETDDVTNSIIVLAPSPLSQEIAELIKQLDENAKLNDRQEIGFVRLEGTNVKNLQEVLQQLLRTRRSRR
jgi:type II secretory pathway component GspD/PulD (secretin)